MMTGFQVYLLMPGIDLVGIGPFQSSILMIDDGVLIAAFSIPRSIGLLSYFHMVV